MSFLAVLIVVFVYRNWLGGNPVQELWSATGWFRWVRSRIDAPLPRYVVAVLIPCLAVAWLTAELDGWLFGLPGLLLALIILTYSVEIIDLDVAFDDYRLTLDDAGQDRDQEDDEQDPTQDLQQDLQQRHERFCTDITYEAFRSIVPALFWFMVLGPMGALLYALNDQFLDDSDDDIEEDPLVDQVSYWLEWIPARAAGLVFAVLGDFRRGLAAFIDSLGDTQNAVALTLADFTGAASQRTASDPAMAEQEAEELRWLLDNSVWGWVGIAALLAIVGW